MDTKRTKFRNELANLINKYSMESGSNTPDFILANYMGDCLDAYDKAVTQRTRWFGKGKSCNEIFADPAAKIILERRDRK